MDYLIYLTANGEIRRPFTGPPGDVAHQLAPGEAAIEGTGNWLTHRVVDGQVVELEVPRQPPFEGAWWDQHAAAWFDPTQRPETAAAGRVQLSALLIGKINRAELRQARPLREIQMAQALGHEVPAQALSALESIELEIASLRTQLAALA